jgi:hypothetical protein
LYDNGSHTPEKPETLPYSGIYKIIELVTGGGAKGLLVEVL